MKIQVKNMSKLISLLEPNDQLEISKRYIQVKRGRNHLATFDQATNEFTFQSVVKLSDVSKEELEEDRFTQIARDK